MNQQSGASDSLVMSYLDLRKAIGVIGTALPFVLAFGKMALDSPGVQGSVSAYYYTVMRDVFVGSMCAMAVFFMSYRGYDNRDALAGKLTCLFALGLALFPVAPEINATPHEKLVGGLHLAFASCFFLTLAYFSLVLFRKTKPSQTPTPRKLQRNAVYTACGYTILACLALVVVVHGLPAGSALLRLDPVFWLEAVAVVAFGLSWLTKGEAILQDE
jgi:cytochrome c biogenesis factor